MSLRGDELMQALLPTVADLIAAVHDRDSTAVGNVFAEAERLAGGPLPATRYLAVLAAGMASEDHSVSAALGWTLDPDEYYRLRSITDALSASLRAGQAMPKGDAA